MRIPNWSALNKLGKSKLISSSYFWIFFVPLVAKLFSNIENPISLLIFDATIVLNLTPPFSWNIFYFSSVFFSAASLIYIFWCPKIVSDFDGFSSFKDAGRGERFLVNNLRSMKPDKLKNPNYKKFVYESFEVDLDKYLNRKKNNNDNILEDNSVITGKREGEFFWYVRNVRDQQNTNLRIVCTLLYLIGFSLFGFVLLENFIFVTKHLF